MSVPGPRRPLAGALLLAVLSFVAAGAAVEGALRILQPHGLSGSLGKDDDFHWLVFDPWLSWRNQAGYRDEAVQIAAPGVRVAPGEGEPATPGAPRVLCLGDSRTFGVWMDAGGLRYDNAYPGVLDALASRSGVALDVVNAGTIGYTSEQGLRQWQMRLAPRRGDVVVTAFGINDHSLVWNDAFRVREPRSRAARRMLYAVADWRWVQLGLSVWRRQLAPDGLVDEAWVEPPDYEHSLERFVAEAERRGARLLFLHLPLRPIERGDNLQLPGAAGTPWGLYRARDLPDLHRIQAAYREILFRVAARHRVPLVDAEVGFEAARRRRPDRPLFSDYDMVHPGRRGARLVAEQVWARLRALRWVGG